MALQSNSKPLQNLGILITRPAHQAANLAQLITNLGGQAILFPTLAIADPEDPKPLQHIFAQLPHYDLAIFISPNAVQKSLPLILKQWGTWPVTLKIACIGKSTALCLQKYGLSADFYPSTHLNSAGLLALPALQNLNGKKVVLFKGQGGLEDLATALGQRGAVITEAIVYRRLIPNPLPTLNVPQSDIHMIVCTSSSGLQNLFKILGPTNRSWLQNMSLLVVSARIAELAKSLGFVKPVLIADNATDIAIVRALVIWQEKLNGKK